MENQKKENMFEIVGYSKDYYIGTKFIGSLPVDEPDREVMGYMGRMEEVVEDTIVFNKNKKIKGGTIVKTELNTLCGRLKK